ncbi:winged helix-turn-helix transcriptional regulator [Streptomyces sp. NBC_01429]|uniref:winged helix-turn-helix transcriptional regulator n=1 Tax=Streptomyces sp. NBC_01429 TaxID=2903862 RepID=UPI002E29532C|nr:helix-turn-helix domain-containing protein [Streptomyces sp. NBC_01429]
MRSPRRPESSSSPAKAGIGILLVTTQGPARFTELERQVKGISRRMLTLTLRNLERDGLLTRTVYPTVPPKVEYTATPMARELYDSLLLLSGWAERHLDDIGRARVEYDDGKARAEAEAEADAVRVRAPAA